METAGSETWHVKAGKNLDRNLRGGNVRRQKYMAVIVHESSNRYLLQTSTGGANGRINSKHQ
jgi:hypothetical protein